MQTAGDPAVIKKGWSDDQPFNWRSHLFELFLNKDGGTRSELLMVKMRKFNRKHDTPKELGLIFTGG